MLLIVIASASVAKREAIQTNRKSGLDCFVAYAPRNDEAASSLLGVEIAPLRVGGFDEPRAVMAGLDPAIHVFLKNAPYEGRRMRSRSGTT